MNRKKAEAVFAVIREYHKEQGDDITEDGWFLADHHHEELSEGSWSLACEGYLEYDWPWRFTEAVFNKEVPGLPEGVHFEAVNGCVLAIYDAE